MKEEGVAATQRESNDEFDWLGRTAVASAAVVATACFSGEGAILKTRTEESSEADRHACAA